MVFHFSKLYNYQCMDISSIPLVAITLLGCNRPTVFFSHIKPAPATSHSQPAVLFSHNKSASATSHSQPAVFFSHNKSASATSHSQPNIVND